MGRSDSVPSASRGLPWRGRPALRRSGVVLKKRAAGIALVFGDLVQCVRREAVWWRNWDAIVGAGRTRLHRTLEAILAVTEPSGGCRSEEVAGLAVGHRQANGGRGCAGIWRGRNWAISRRRRRLNVSRSFSGAVDCLCRFQNFWACADSACMPGLLRPYSVSLARPFGQLTRPRIRIVKCHPVETNFEQPELT